VFEEIIACINYQKIAELFQLDDSEAVDPPDIRICCLNLRANFSAYIYFTLSFQNGYI
jgi:hypothetical protein